MKGKDRPNQMVVGVVGGGGVGVFLWWVGFGLFVGWGWGFGFFGWGVFGGGGGGWGFWGLVWGGIKKCEVEKSESAAPRGYEGSASRELVGEEESSRRRERGERTGGINTLSRGRGNGLPGSDLKRCHLGEQGGGKIPCHFQIVRKKGEETRSRFLRVWKKGRNKTLVCYPIENLSGEISGRKETRTNSSLWTSSSRSKGYDGAYTTDYQLQAKGFIGARKAHDQTKGKQGKKKKADFFTKPEKTFAQDGGREADAI